MEKEREAAPRVVSRGDGLAERVDDEPCGRKRVEVRGDRPMLALERHAESVASDGVGVAKLVEVTAANHESAVLLEAASRIERMDDREAGHAIGLEHARDFVHSGAEIIDVMQAHERDDPIERRIVERDRGCIGNVKLHVRRELARGGDERGRRVDADYAMASDARCRVSLPSPQPTSSARRAGGGTMGRN